MPHYFLDSSALVKRYRKGVGTPWVLQLSAAANRLIVSRLAHIEVASAIIRRGRQSAGAAQAMTSALGSLESEIDSDFDVVEFTAPVTSRAMDLVRVHGLRAADAIQLACALLSSAELPAVADFYLVSADDELNDAAAAEGLHLENPNQHT